MRAAVLVPVKAFAHAKLRLAPALAAPAREALARSMAEAVVAAARPLSTAVVCDDDAVATWARALGVDVLWTPGLGLDGAVAAGVAALRENGVHHVTVAHADLPLADDLTWVARFPGGVTLVPDRRHDGTNVVGIPTSIDFRFAYGPGSFARHHAEARRHPVPLRVVRRAALEWDVDLPEDLTYAGAP